MISLNSKSDILNIVKKSGTEDPLNYVIDSIEGYGVDKLSEQVSQCDRCNLGLDKNNIIYHKDNKILIINEKNTEEDLYISSYSYQVYDYLMRQNGMSIEDANIINCINCKYDDIPNKEMTTNCMDFVHKFIDLSRPEIIILCGTIPIRLFRDENVLLARGNIVKAKGIKAVCTHSPDVILKSGEVKTEEEMNTMRNEIERDFKKIIKILKGDE